MIELWKLYLGLCLAKEKGIQSIEVQVNYQTMVTYLSSIKKTLL